MGTVLGVSIYCSWCCEEEGERTKVVGEHDLGQRPRLDGRGENGSEAGCQSGECEEELHLAVVD
jgi:hypothetical protein